MENSMVMNLVWLVVSIGIILVAILKLKYNATVALIIAAAFMGLISGLDPAQVASTINSGFGNLITSVGFSIGFGVILGQLLSDSGGAKVIAVKMVSIATEKYSLYALGITAFILSIPVFYAVTFVILVPLGVAITKQLKKPLPYAIGAVSIGAGAAHTLAPPTPNPMMAADILGFDLGLMVAFGTGFGLLAAVLAMKIYFTMLDKGFWNPEKDETGIVLFEEEQEDKTKPQMSFGAAIFPVLLPIALILSGTLAGNMMEEVPAIIKFISNSGMALFIAVMSALLLTSKVMTAEEKEKSSNKSLESCGAVLLITGAGASFGAILQATGLADTVAQSINNISASPVLALFIGFGIAFALRFALGSGTVASITAMNIMATVPAAVGLHPVWMALACLSGSLAIGHVNDSGFWITSNMAGFSVSGGLKCYTLAGALTGAIVMVVAVIGAFVMPA